MKRVGGVTKGERKKSGCDCLTLYVCGERKVVSLTDSVEKGMNERRSNMKRGER